MKNSHARAASPVLSRIRRSPWRVVVQGLALVGMILQPAPMARSYWTDLNNDGVKEEVADPETGDSWWTADGDGDGWNNEAEAFYGSDPYRRDSDLDGLVDKDEHDWTPLNNPWLWDTDGDGYSDHDEYYHALQATTLVVNYNTLVANSQAFYRYSDADGDGIPNPEDSDPTNNDRDADGLLNWQDVGYMDDPNNGYTPPDTTTDTDGDSVPDYYDPFPNGSYLYLGQEFGGTFTDTDGDGIPNPADPFPNGSYSYNGQEYAGAWVDQDGDGIPDEHDPFPGTFGHFWYQGTLYAGVDADSDADGIPDVGDPFPNGSHTYLGVEYEGPMVDQDGDGIPDWDDPFPNGSHLYNGLEYGGAMVDQDGDAIPDWDDPFPIIAGSHTYQGMLYGGPLQDADGDTIPDWDDLFPNGSYLYNGVEYGGVFADPDNDGIPSPADPFPTLSGSYWYNGTQYGGPWIDTDNDGIPDAHDAFPSGSFFYDNVEYAAPWADSDGDTIPDPADSFPNGSYTYLNVEYAGAWADADTDGIPDEHDSFPNGSYMYLGTEYAGAWVDTDGDGKPDAHDTFPNGSYLYLGVEYAGAWVDTDGDGVPDAHDPFPEIAGSYWYNEVQYSGYWTDTDGDGIPNPQDGWPTDRWNGEPYYTYNGIEYGGVWADYDDDDIPDPADSWPQDPVNGLDNDGDGLTNYAERTQHYTNPNLVDSDADYLTDSEELLIYHTHPLQPISNPEGGQTLLDGYVHMGADTDDDGLPDLIEKHYRVLGYGLSETNPADGAGDLDGDNINNLNAYYQGWDLAAHMDETDRDGDGITDVTEDSWSAIYPGILDKTLFADAVGDYDLDGIFNFEEVLQDSDPGDARSYLATTPGSPLFNQLQAWRSDVERGDFTTGTDGEGNPVSSPAPAEYTDGEDVSPANGKPDGYEYWIANRLNGIAPAPSGPLDGQIRAWRLDVERPDFTDYGPDTSGQSVFGPASAEYLSWDDTIQVNGVPDGYEHWVTNRLGEFPPPAAACNLIDQDGDGMSNEWEHRHRFNLRYNGDAGPLMDTVVHTNPGSAREAPVAPTAPTAPTSEVPPPDPPTPGQFVNTSAYSAHLAYVTQFNLDHPPEEHIVADPESMFLDGDAYDSALSRWNSDRAEHSTYATALSEYNTALAAYNAALLAYQAYPAAAAAYAYAELVDPDRDGLSNLREFTLHTDPRCADSDGDGFEDGLELANGVDALRRDSLPPLTLTVSSGNNQTTVLGTSVAGPLEVFVHRAGKAAAGIPVTFTVADDLGTLTAEASGEGTATLTVTTTTSQPTAKAYLSAPTEAGSRSITASIPSGQSVAFSAWAIPPVTITTSSLPSGEADWGFYSASLAATGGSGGPYAWAVTAGSLPSGLFLTASGQILGTPTVAGTSTFTVRASDGGGRAGYQAFTITVTPPLPTVINTTAVSDADKLTDSDNDGVCDAQELAEGTDPFSAGSNSNALVGLTVLTPVIHLETVVPAVEISTNP